MALFRQLRTGLWQDGFILGLKPKEKYFYIYLMTNARTTQCGIFKLVKPLAELELGYDRETIDELLKSFVDYGKIDYCEETDEIMVVNWIKYNFINSKNTILCINKELKDVKNKEFVKILYKLCVEKDYPIEQIFNGILLDLQKNEEVIPSETDNKETENSITPGEGGIYSEADDKGLSGPYEAPYKPLGEEEIYINKTNNKQKVFNKNIKSKDEKSISRVLVEFSKNIKKASKSEVKKLVCWTKKFEEEFIIAAINQAVKYNVKHIGYIEGVIKNWVSQGITTVKELMKKVNRTSGRVNFDAYEYVD